MNTAEQSVNISDRDYTLIIDKSGSMDQPWKPGTSTSKWDYCQETVLALANLCAKIDPDGITVYTFAGKFRRHDNVTSAKVKQIFQEEAPAGTTNLTDVLKDALDNHFSKINDPNSKPETIIVITDGEPDDRKSVFETIISATKKLTDPVRIRLLFFQIGQDTNATRFLKALDEELKGVGAKYDICDVTTTDEIEDLSLKEVLLKALTD